ncbi:hypothetical protein SAY86_004262 [Trapa natans]|uniref:Uncharacterized protein n=1 Tax=Trapa natans TaxID=22666 RepID=A0AAN7MYF1_TRANT|nr:hypothetical protein SAY86_004262 [Trapa natans]
MFRHWAPKAPLQTLTANSLAWAEKKPSLDCDEAIPGRERLSFAANQPVSDFMWRSFTDSAKEAFPTFMVQGLTCTDAPFKGSEDEIEVCTEVEKMLASSRSHSYLQYRLQGGSPRIRKKAEHQQKEP